MRALLIVFVFACSSPSKPKPTVTPPPVGMISELSSSRLAPLAWWLGDWQAEGGDPGVEYWVAASGAMYGVSLHDGGTFEVMIVDDGAGPGKPDGILRFIAMPGGERQVEFQMRDSKDKAITFANDEHDYPKSIMYARDGDVLHAQLGGGKTTVRTTDFHFKAVPETNADVLVQADLAFAKATAERGIEGWVAAFDAKGAMMRRDGRVEGADKIREMMGPVLAKTKVAWEPVASRVRGDIGFTVGKATFTGEESFRSTYVTIWKKQVDGGWKVLFDTGRVVNEPEP